MNIYKEATKLKLRFDTPKGYISSEQLWSLSMTDLATTIKQAKNLLISSATEDDLSFLTESASAVNPKDQLTFDILKDVYITKKEERDAIKQEADKKAHNQKILALIHDKKEGELKDKSVEELEKMLQ